MSKPTWKLVEAASTWTLASPAWEKTSPDGRQHVIDKIQRHAQDQREADELFSMITGHPYPGSETS